MNPTDSEVNRVKRQNVYATLKGSHVSRGISKYNMLYHRGGYVMIMDWID